MPKTTLHRLTYLLPCLLFLFQPLLPAPRPAAPPTIPTTWDILADDFESGALDKWSISSSNPPNMLPGGGVNGSTGLSVSASSESSYIYQTGVAKAEEAYLTFWFNPNGVSLPEPDPNYWPPGSSLSVAEVVNSDDWWPPLVALYLRRPAGEGYQAYLAWPTNEAGDRHYDYENAFALSDGWQKITVGYSVDEWVAAWVDDVLVRYNDTTVVHPDPYGDIIFFGQVRDPSSSPSGATRFDNLAFQVPRRENLWVDAQGGDDSRDGATAATALRTIQRAADLAGPGTSVHILDGVYRESVWPALNGSAAEPVRYLAENGPGSVVIRGSEPSSSLVWTQMSADSIGLPPGIDPGNLYYTDLSSWELEDPPRFIFADGNTRLPLAREPDWSVVTEWKHHEYWWAADGGSTPAACDPAADADPNCDYSSRSLNQLTDRSDDSLPAGIEAGNLTTLGDLTGATLVAIDTLQGHYVYRRMITGHDVSAGRVTVDRICEHDGGSGEPGLGWGSKYYLENKPALLDSPGEWWYDESSGYLYLWPPDPGDPASQDIEISRRDHGFSLRDRSYISLEDLTIEMHNHSAVYQHNWTEHKSYANTLSGLNLRYANYGLYIEQGVAANQPVSNVIDGFSLLDSEIAYIDSQGIRLIDWWENGANPDDFSHSGVLNTTIQGNEFHHLGFRTDGDNAIGLSFTFANKLRFENNHLHHVAHNGIQFSRSVIQSTKEANFDPDEIKTGEILVKDNLIEKACQLTTDCGGLKIWGSPPDNHVFRDFLLTGNVFRNSYGWTHVSEQRRRWMGGESSQVRGLGGFGLYLDHVSGVHAYRNIAYNNAYTGYMVYREWYDGPLIYVNNVAANSLHGMSIGGVDYDEFTNVDTQIIDNILVNNEAFGISLHYAQGRTANMTVDHNLYFKDGWRSFEDGGIWHAGVMVIREYDQNNNRTWDPYETLSELQAATPWEASGEQGAPAFWDYDPEDHDLHDGSWPDFHLTAASAAIDLGVTALPASLSVLLDHFEVEDYHLGAAYDAGRYEGGFLLQAAPASYTIDPGETIHYTLSLFPADLPHAVTLTPPKAPSGLELSLSPAALTTPLTATLTVSDTGAAAGVWHSLSIGGSGGGFTHTVNVSLLIGGVQLYLPVVSR